MEESILDCKLQVENMSRISERVLQHMCQAARGAHDGDADTLDAYISNMQEKTPSPASSPTKTAAACAEPGGDGDGCVSDAVAEENPCCWNPHVEIAQLVQVV